MDLINYHLEISEMSQDEANELKRYFKGTPSEFIRIGPSGYVFPKYENIMEQLSFFYNMQVRKTDTFVASFPRSGTTMTQELVWLIGNNLNYETASSKHLCERYISLRSYVDNALVKATKIEEYQQRKCKHIGRLQRMTWPTDKLVDTNDNRFIMSHIPFSMLPPDTLDTAKVVYVARNPLDVAVSMFHFYRSLKMYEFVGDFKTFWYYFTRGSTMWTPYFAHVKQAWKKRSHPNMLFLFYEENTKVCLCYESKKVMFQISETKLLADIKIDSEIKMAKQHEHEQERAFLFQDLPAAIRRISTFLNKSYSDEQIRGLCEHMKFENFQKNEAVNLDFLKEFDDVFVPFEQSFIRKGKTGGWQDYFDEAMTKEACSWIEENLRDTDLKFPGLDVLLKANQNKAAQAREE